MSQTTFPVPSATPVPAGTGALVSSGLATTGSYAYSSLTAGNYLLVEGAGCKSMYAQVGGKTFSTNSNALAFNVSAASKVSVSTFNEPNFTGIRALSPNSNVFNDYPFGYTASPIAVNYIGTINGYHYAMYSSSSAGTKLQRSKDLVVWQTMAYDSNANMLSGAGNQQHYKIATVGSATYIYGNDNNSQKFVAFISYDNGETWARFTSAAIGTGSVGAVAYGAGVFVTYSGSNNTFYSSTDGVTWTSRGSGSFNLAINAVNIMFVNNVFIAVGGTYLYTSTNGTSWTLRTSSLVNSGYAVAYGNSLYMLISMHSSGAQTYTSTDLITWTSRNTSQSFTPQAIWSSNGVNGTDLEFINGKFYACLARDPSGAGGYATTTDGITWTVTDSGFKYRSLRVTSDGQLVMLVGSTSYSWAYFSTDGGVSFTTRAFAIGATFAPSHYASSSVYNIDVFAVSAANNQTSTTYGSSGTRALHTMFTFNTVTETWVTALNISAFTVYSVTCGSDGAIYMYSNNGVYRTTDGVTWTLVSATNFTVGVSLTMGTANYVASDATGFYTIGSGTLQKIDLNGNRYIWTMATFSTWSSSTVLQAYDGVLLINLFNGSTYNLAAIDTRPMVSSAMGANGAGTNSTKNVLSVGTSPTGISYYPASWSVYLSGNKFVAMYLGVQNATSANYGTITYIWDTTTGVWESVSPTARANATLKIANMGIVQGTPVALVADGVSTNDQAVYPKLTYLQMAPFQERGIQEGFSGSGNFTNSGIGRMSQWVSYGTALYNDQNSSSTLNVNTFHTNPKYGKQSVAFNYYGSFGNTQPLYYGAVVKLPFTAALLNLYSITATTYN